MDVPQPTLIAALDGVVLTAVSSSSEHSPPPARVPTLALLGLSGHVLRWYTLSRDQVTLGRRMSNDIELPDPSVSRYHAQVANDGAHWYIDDLGSTNGTYMNGRRLRARTVLRGGEILQVGLYRLRFQL